MSRSKKRTRSDEESGDEDWTPDIGDVDDWDECNEVKKKKAHPPRAKKPKVVIVIDKDAQTLKAVVVRKAAATTLVSESYQGDFETGNRVRWRKRSGKVVQGVVLSTHCKFERRPVLQFKGSKAVVWEGKHESWHHTYSRSYVRVIESSSAGTLHAPRWFEATPEQVYVVTQSRSTGALHETLVSQSRLGRGSCRLTLVEPGVRHLPLPTSPKIIAGNRVAFADVVTQRSVTGIVYSVGGPFDDWISVRIADGGGAQVHVSSWKAKVLDEGKIHPLPDTAVADRVEQQLLVDKDKVLLDPHNVDSETDSDKDEDGALNA